MYLSTDLCIHLFALQQPERLTAAFRRHEARHRTPKAEARAIPWKQRQVGAACGCTTYERTIDSCMRAYTAMCISICKHSYNTFFVLMYPSISFYICDIYIYICVCVYLHTYFLRKVGTWTLWLATLLKSRVGRSCSKFLASVLQADGGPGLAPKSGTHIHPVFLLGYWAGSGSL